MKFNIKLLRIIRFLPLFGFLGIQQVLAADAQDSQASHDDRIIDIAKNDLERYPYIVYQGLLQSLVKKDMRGIDAFLPAYRKLANADPAFIRWAMAVQAWHDGKYRQAIEQYRWLIAQYPDNEIIRLQLAIALFDNQDNEAAEQQFQKLRSGKRIPLVGQIIDEYLTNIRQRDFWSFTGFLSNVNEKNINNAPPPGTRLNGWIPAPPESAAGFSYGLNAQKSWSFVNGIFSEYRFSGYGNRFWNNRKYDELTVRNGVGIGYRDSDVKLLLMPFFEQRWYGGGPGNQGGMRRYANMHGIRGESRYRLTPHWLLYGEGEYGMIRHNTKKYLNGNEHELSATAVFFPQPNQYWFIRASYKQKNSRDLDDSYYRYGLRAGWGYEWPYGISSRLQIGYGRKQYRGKDFFGILQKNDEYSGVITLWHRGLYFKGVTPKISWIYQKTRSNHPFYGFDKKRILLNLSKDF